MSKTPVSFVQELCAKYQITPQYDLIYDEDSIKNLYFKYRVIVNDVIGFGVGNSKKEAKHEAAKDIYTRLRMKYGSEVVPAFPTVGNEELLPQLSIASPYQGTVRGNVVGELGTLCLDNTYPVPHYELIGEEGPPHEKTFTFTCSVAKLTESASSRTKQQAKHLSATLMLKRLKRLLGYSGVKETEKIITNGYGISEDFMFLDTKEISNALDAAEKEFERSYMKTASDLDEAVKKKYSSLRSRTRKRLDLFNISLGSYHELSLPIASDTSNDYFIRLVNYSEKINDDPCHLLAGIAENEGKNVSYLEIPSLTSIVLCVCELSSPYFNTPGSGATEYEAQVEAAHNMIMHLKTFL